jgi:hypothetical protein
VTAPRYGSWGLSAKDMTSTVTPLDTRGPKRLWSQGPGFVIRRRGATDEPVALEFMCPVHGRFTARVSKEETPDEMPCPRVDLIGRASEFPRTTEEYCGRTSPWSPSGFAAWKSSGEVTG